MPSEVLITLAVIALLIFSMFAVVLSRYRKCPSDKIMVICEALHVTPEQLLIGKCGEASLSDALQPDEIDVKILEELRALSDGQKKRLLAYASMLRNGKEGNSRETE